RKDTLSTFLFLATLLAYAEYVRALEGRTPSSAQPRDSAAQLRDNAPSPRVGRGRPPLLYLTTFVLFVLGLSAKPMLITLPFVLLLLDFWPLKRGLHILEKVPLFALTIPSAIITMHAQKEAIHPIA